MTDKRKIIEIEDRYMVVQDMYGKNREEEIIERSKFVHNERARIAIEMVTKWGTVAAQDAGEDSSGRAKMELMPPHQLVARAMTTADLLMNAIEASGWMIKVPHPDELTLDGETE